jgi:hypothetical protein
MKVIAHVNVDGEIQGLIATPDEKLNLALTVPAGVQVCEIAEHGLEREAVDLEQLGKLLETHTVELPPVRGKLVRRRR